MGLWRTTLRSRVKPFVYKYRNRFLYKLASFYVNTVDNDNDSDHWTNGEAAFAREKLRGAKIAFDVGAAFGDWTMIALEANPHLVVHCFEPASPRFKHLTDLKLGDRARLNRLGFGDSSAHAPIFFNTSGGSNSLYAPRDSTAREAETITLTTIDAYCAENSIEYVDFIKMDIEGYEMTALRGAREMLSAGRIGVVQFEYSEIFFEAGTSLKDLMSFIRETNPAYEFYKLYPDGARHVPRYDHGLETFKLQNWAFVKRTP